MASINVAEVTRLIEDTGQNLIDNGDCERFPAFTAVTTVSGRYINGAASGSSVDLGYRYTASGSGGFAGSFDTSTFHTGTAALKISTTATASYIECRYRTMGYWDVGTVYLYPSTKYTCTFWMKTNYVSGDSASGAFVDFIESKADGTAAGQETSTAPVKVTQDWTKFTLNFTTLSTTSWGHPEFRIYGHTGTATLIMDAWFDDVTLAASSTVSGGNIAVPISPIVTNPIQMVAGPKIWS